MYTTTTEDKKKLQEVSLILKGEGKQKKNEKVQISTEAELLTIKSPYSYNALIYTGLRDLQAVKKMKQKDKTKKARVQKEAEWKLKIITFRKHLILSPSVFR